MNLRPHHRFVAGFAGLFALSLVAGASAAGALDIKVKPPAAPGGDTTIEITGLFAPGDGLKMRAELSHIPAEQIVVAHLNAGGGNTAEAMSIGRLFHRSGIKTIIPPKARCIAPCPLVFVGGFDRRKNEPAMVKHSTASMGVTAYISNRVEKDYSYKDLDLAVAGIQKSILVVAEYLQEIGADVDFLKFYFKPAAEKVTNYISDEQLLDIGASIYDDDSKQLVDGMALRRRRQ